MECGQVTFETSISKGPITCEVYYILNIPNKTTHFESTYGSMQDIIKNTVGVTNIKVSDYRDQTSALYDTNYQIDFTLENEIDCIAEGMRRNDGTSAQYSFMCSQIVPDFLPGYTIEK